MARRNERLELIAITVNCPDGSRKELVGQMAIDWLVKNLRAWAPLATPAEPGGK